MSFIAIVLSLLYFVYVEYKERQYKSVLIIVVLTILASSSNLLMFILDRFDIFSNTTAITITDHSSQTRIDRINFPWIVSSILRYGEMELDMPYIYIMVLWKFWQIADC